MALADIDADELRALEESLWREETRFDRAYMDRILADDFTEHGRSGRTYTRAECLDVVRQPIHARLPLEALTIRRLDDRTVLVTYVSEVGANERDRATRSSIWSVTEAGWRLRFHQGTPTA